MKRHPLINMKQQHSLPFNAPPSITLEMQPAAVFKGTSSTAEDCSGPPTLRTSLQASTLVFCSSNKNITQPFSVPILFPVCPRWGRENISYACLMN